MDPRATKLRERFDAFSDSGVIRFALWCFVVAYYLLSAVFILADETQAGGILVKGGLFDSLTSIAWGVFAACLISKLAGQVHKGSMNLGSLIEAYILFIFLFAFLYGLLEWHWPKEMLSGVNPSTFLAEAQYFLLSVGAQTGSTYGRAQPAHVVTELIAAFQALLGIYFLAVWVSLALSRTPK